MGMIIWLVNLIFRVLNLLIIVRVILSWLRPNYVDPRWHNILKFIYKTTEPILAPIRRILPTGSMGFDFSPIIAIIALSIIRRFLLNLMANFMYGF